MPRAGSRGTRVQDAQARPCCNRSREHPARDVRRRGRGRAPHGILVGRSLGVPFAVLVVAVALWVIVFFRLGAPAPRPLTARSASTSVSTTRPRGCSRSSSRPFITVRGLDVFGHHMTPGLWFFAPVLLGRWRAEGVARVAGVVAGASARSRCTCSDATSLRSRGSGAGLGVVLLLHPTSQWLVWEFFHPEAFAIGPLLFAYWAARTKRWNWFWPCAFVAIAMKEDLALAFVVHRRARRGARRVESARLIGGAGTGVVRRRDARRHPVAQRCRPVLRAALRRSRQLADRRRVVPRCAIPVARGRSRPSTIGSSTTR